MIDQEKLESLYGSVLESSMKARIERVKSKFEIIIEFEESKFREGEGIFWAEIEEFPKIYDAGRTEKEATNRVARRLINSKINISYNSGIDRRADSKEQKEKILDIILEVWTAYPDQRLGQLLENAASRDLFYIEDLDLVESLKENIEKYLTQLEKDEN